jgi:hypothetical protein
MSYERYVRTNVLAPMGITNMRIGQTLPQGKLPGETEYNGVGKAHPCSPTSYRNRFPGHTAAGTWKPWIPTAAGRQRHRLRQVPERHRWPARHRVPQAIQHSGHDRPPGHSRRAGKNSWYGFGLGITSEITSVDWSHNGALDGTSTYQGRTYNGLVWTVFLNWFGQSPR